LKIRKKILRKLNDKQAFLHGHMLFERLQSGIPLHSKDFVRNILKELVKERIVLLYAKTKYGKSYQPNITKLEEIEELLD